MENFIIAKVGTREVEIMDGKGKIEVREELTAGEQENIVSQGMGEQNPFTIFLLYLKAYIVKWNFASEDGQVHPINMEVLRTLPDSIINEMIEKISGKTIKELIKLGQQGGNIFSKAGDSAKKK